MRGGEVEVWRVGLEVWRCRVSTGGVETHLQPGLDGLEPGPVVGEAVGQAHVREQQHLLLLRHLVEGVRGQES